MAGAHEGEMLGNLEMVGGSFFILGFVEKQHAMERKQGKGALGLEYWIGVKV